MKPRAAKLGVRKNPDSSRVHGLRLSVGPSSSESGTQKLCRLLPENRGHCAFLPSNWSISEEQAGALAALARQSVRSESSLNWKL